jgi:hypothetical protein
MGRDCASERRSIALAEASHRTRPGAALGSHKRRLLLARIAAGVRGDGARRVRLSRHRPDRGLRQPDGNGDAQPSGKADSPPKLAKALACQRSRGRQVVRVEHITVNVATALIEGTNSRDAR